MKQPTDEKTTLDYLADAIRFTNRAIQATNSEARDRLIKKSNMSLLLMEAKVSGLLPGDGRSTDNDWQVTVFEKAGTGLELDRQG